MCKRKFLKCRIILDDNEIHVHVFVIKSTKINVCLILSVSNQQIELIEKYLEEELSKRIENFSMGEFTKTIMYVLYLFIWHLLLLICHISYTYQDAKDSFWNFTATIDFSGNAKMNLKVKSLRCFWPSVTLCLSKKCSWITEL